jgi:hypothetical protein
MQSVAMILNLTATLSDKAIGTIFPQCMIISLQNLPCWFLPHHPARLIALRTAGVYGVCDFVERESAGLGAAGAKGVSNGRNATFPLRK